MAKKPTEAQAKRKGWIGAYRGEAGAFHAYDAEGRTKAVTQAEAEEIGVKG